jgi:hypothetical protein
MPSTFGRAVLGVDDHDVEAVLGAQPGQALGQPLHRARPDDVADEEHVHDRQCAAARGRDVNDVLADTRSSPRV